jgi:hypothetical protein
MTSNDGFIGFLPAHCQNGSCGASKPADWEDRGWEEVSGLLLCGTCVDAADIGIEQTIARISLLLERERDSWEKPTSFNYKTALTDLVTRIEALA